MRIVLLTGATGYVGGRLLPELEARGDLRVRCLARRPGELRPRVAAETEVVEGDLLQPATLGPALRGADAAYYLVHSMGEGQEFEELDRRAAENFAAAAEAEGVGRIVYLGGLGEGSDLSPHLRSRQEVGRILRTSGVPTLELRASVVIGGGSLSFEMIRALVERLPVMLLPRWVRQDTQPIAVGDVTAYLVAALDGEAPTSRVYQIGGADRVSYAGIMREYARQRGLRRWMIPVPVLTPWLSGLWLGLVTPVYARVGRTLAGSLAHETVVTDPAAEETYGVGPVGVREAIRRGRREEDRDFARIRWCEVASGSAPASSGSGASPSSDTAPPPERAPAGADGQRLARIRTVQANRYVDSRARRVPVPPRRAFQPIRSIGESAGRPFPDGLWRLRGRVERIEPGRLLRLRAEMRLPGRAWLQFEVEPEGDGSVVRQTALFDPRGVGGRAYWHLLRPLHALVFRGMLRGICRAAVSE